MFAEREVSEVIFELGKENHLKKLLSLFLAIVLLSVIITGCDKMPSQKEIQAARLNAISYAATAYDAVSEEEWFDDYTLIGIYIGGNNYASCKEPVKKYTSVLRIDEVTTVTLDNVKEADCDFIFFFADKGNKSITCDVDVYLLGRHTATSAETGEIIKDSQQYINVFAPHIVDDSDENWIDEYYAEVRQNGYRVYSEDDICFFIEANEIL